MVFIQDKALREVDPCWLCNIPSVIKPHNWPHTWLHPPGGWCECSSSLILVHIWWGMCYNGTDHCHCVSGEEQCSGKLWIWIPATGSQDHQGHRCCLICDADNITHFWQRWPEGGATLGCQLSLQWSTTVLYRSKELSLSLISRIYVNKQSVSLSHIFTIENRMIGFAAWNTLESGPIFVAMILKW